jgi:hypothetical protein
MEYGDEFCASMGGKKKMEAAHMEAGQMPHFPMMGMGHHMGKGEMGMCPWCHGMGLTMRGQTHKDPMMLAKQAKQELLNEKIKARIERKYGDKLDKIADEIVEITAQKLHMKLEFMKKKMEMKSRIWEMMAEFVEEEGTEENIPEAQAPQEEWHEG